MAKKTFVDLVSKIDNHATNNTTLRSTDEKFYKWFFNDFRDTEPTFINAFQKDIGVYISGFKQHVMGLIERKDYNKDAKFNDFAATSPLVISQTGTNWIKIMTEQRINQHDYSAYATAEQQKALLAGFNATIAKTNRAAYSQIPLYIFDSEHAQKSLFAPEELKELDKIKEVIKKIRTKTITKKHTSNIYTELIYTLNEELINFSQFREDHAANSEAFQYPASYKSSDLVLIVSKKDMLQLKFVKHDIRHPDGINLPSFGQTFELDIPQGNAYIIHKDFFAFDEVFQTLFIQQNVRSLDWQHVAHFWYRFFVFDILPGLHIKFSDPSITTTPATPVASSGNTAA